MIRTVAVTPTDPRRATFPIVTMVLRRSPQKNGSLSGQPDPEDMQCERMGDHGQGITTM